MARHHRCQRCSVRDVWDRVRYLDANGELTTYPARVFCVESRICLTCKHVQGIGPANDTPAAMVELELAEALDDVRRLWESGRAREEAEAPIIDDYADGRGHSDVYRSARCIATHEETT